MTKQHILSLSYILIRINRSTASCGNFTVCVYISMSENGQSNVPLGYLGYNMVIWGLRGYLESEGGVVVKA